MGLVHKQTVHTQLLKSHHIVFSSLALQLFKSGFKRLSGTLQLFNGKTLAAAGLYLCNPLGDLVDLLIQRPRRSFFTIRRSYQSGYFSLASASDSRLFFISACIRCCSPLLSGI